MLDTQSLLSGEVGRVSRPPGHTYGQLTSPCNHLLAVKSITFLLISKRFHIFHPIATTRNPKKVIEYFSTHKTDGGHKVKVT